jgi:hypothetical protein
MSHLIASVTSAASLSLSSNAAIFLSSGGTDLIDSFLAVPVYLQASVPTSSSSTAAAEEAASFGGL